MVKVKICGITNLGDALAAAEFGADMIGFNFYSKSPRYLTPEDAAKIGAGIPKGVLQVGVFVSSTTDKISEIANAVGLDIIQLHGDEDDNFIRVVGFETECPVIKSFRISEDTPSESIVRSDADAVLLDTSLNGEFGGTGETFDWNLIGSDLRSRQIFLAGGLTPENVAEAVRFIRPYAVDVATGVEMDKRKKDPVKLKAFIENAKRA